MKKADSLRVLMGLGLKSYEAQIYLANLQLGTAPVARISEVSGVTRSFCYQAIQELVLQGLIAASKTATTQHYTALPIDVLYERQEAAFRSFQRALPDFRLLQDQAPPKPGILFLTGDDALYSALLALPNQVPERSELIMILPSQQVKVAQLLEVTEFREKLVARGVQTTVITDQNHDEAHELTTYRVLEPNRYPLAAALLLFDEQVILLSDQSDTYVTHFTGSEMSRTIRSLLEHIVDSQK